MFERKQEQLLPLPHFIRRMVLSFLLAFGIAAGALLIGVVGYHHFAQLAWIDSLLNASMILTGMGPVAEMKTTTAKLFASGYALFSGGVFLTSLGILLAPVFHRILHWFHLDDETQD